MIGAALVGWAKPLARRFAAAKTRVRRAHQRSCIDADGRHGARKALGRVEGRTFAFAHPTIHDCFIQEKRRARAEPGASSDTEALSRRPAPRAGSGLRSCRAP